MIGASPYARNLPGTFFWSSFRDAFQSVSVAVRSAGDAGGSGAARRGRHAVAVPVSAGGAPMPRGGALVVGVHSCPVRFLVSIRRPVAESSAGRPRWTCALSRSWNWAVVGSPRGLSTRRGTVRDTVRWFLLPARGRLVSTLCGPACRAPRREKAQADGAELRSNREVAPISPPAIGVSAARR